MDSGLGKLQPVRVSHFLCVKKGREGEGTLMYDGES